jgi:hypothetical protein
MTDNINWAKLAQFTANLAKIPVERRDVDGVFTAEEAKILQEGLSSLTRTYRDWEKKPCCGERFGHFITCTTRTRS